MKSKEVNGKFKVVIFEDNVTTAQQIIKFIEDNSKHEIQIECEWYNPNGTGVEKYLENDESIGMVALDWDLTKYKKFVSRQAIEGVCDELGIPICIYPYASTLEEKIRRMKRWDENKIWLRDFKTIEDLEKKLLSVAIGFAYIRNKLDRSEQPRINLGNLLNEILHTPDEAQINIDQYLWSRFRPLQLIESKNSKSNRMISALIGYWIYNVLLQFPGPIVSKGAASSYLDILESDFEKSEINDIFSDAMYLGPFKETGPYWWTRKIDVILASNTTNEDKEVISGFILAERKLLGVSHSRCFANHDVAGYYCIIRQTPVCEIHSVNPSGWVPPGADLTRIEKRKYEELSPWIDL